MTSLVACHAQNHNLILQILGQGYWLSLMHDIILIKRVYSSICCDLQITRNSRFKPQIHNLIWYLIRAAKCDCNFKSFDFCFLFFSSLFSHTMLSNQKLFTNYDHWEYYCLHISCFKNVMYISSTIIAKLWKIYFPKNPVHNVIIICSWNFANLYIYK